MPYTPPSHRSPASSAPSSPDASRRPSLTSGGARPSLPRSASYLTRHRRTPSATTHNGAPPHQPTPEATSEDLKGMVASSGSSLSNSVRKSPPPVTDGRGMPNGAIISPPESSDDDDMPEVRSRRLDSIKQLHAVISQIPQHRESSPAKSPDISPKAPMLVIPQPSPPADVGDGGMHHSFSTGSLGNLAGGSGRRISHMRSATDSDILVTKSADHSLTGSDADSEEEAMMRKPQMVRKKSGELVRPALRPASARRRPSSMPGTPTFSKMVHFDSHLEHVRHFLQVDRPLAVSAGSSPADNYSSDSEYPFNQPDVPKEPRTPPFEWEITVTNFPVETPARKELPVRLEKVWLSPDQKSLIGTVDVANLAFQKHVTCRFTLDYWKTTSEVAAEYSAEILPRTGTVSHDRFNFTIKLSEVANLESKTLYFCLRYNVNGQELWDNNGGTNFQIDFRKKLLPMNGKRGFQGAASRPAGGELPRSHNRRANPSTAPRPKSMPATMAIEQGEFGEPSNGKIKFDQSIHDFLGEEEPTMKLKSSKSSGSLPSDNLPSRLTAPSGQAFANRYDFGASLSTAIQAAKNGSTLPKSSVISDGLYMKPHTRGSAKQVAAPPAPAPVVEAPTPSPKSVVMKMPAPNPTANVANTAKVLAKEPPTTTQASNAANASTSGPSSMSTASYEELVSKYCFFGSKQNSPQLKDGTIRSGRFDGPDDISPNSSGDSSLTGSPLQMGSLGRFHLVPVSDSKEQHQLQHIEGALHHSLPKDSNPYFHQASLVGFGQSTSPGSPRSPLLLNAMMEQQQQQRVSPPNLAPAQLQAAQKSFRNIPTAQMTSTATAQSAGSANSVTNMRAPSPSLVSGFRTHTVTSEYQYPQIHHGLFPFHGVETHSSPAIRG